MLLRGLNWHHHLTLSLLAMVLWHCGPQDTVSGSAHQVTIAHKHAYTRETACGRESGEAVMSDDLLAL